MDDFERLRRGGYRADASSKASMQEAEELSRNNFQPDALAKALEQEQAELEAERRARARAARREAHNARKAQAPSARPDRDLGNREVVHRSATQRQEGPSGGAVVSKRSGLGVAVRRMLREEGSDQRKRERAVARERRRSERAQRKQTRGPRRGPHPLIVFLVALFALYMVVCAPIDRAISFTHEERSGLSKELSWHVPGMPYYVLALGSDAREGETASRTDTMILVRVDPLGGKLTMLSIPRDTKVELEGYGTQKINAAYYFGGVSGAVRAVHKLTGAPISHAAIVRFDGVENLVDYLGGVTVDVPVEVNDPYYTGLQLPAGPQEMDGHTALLFSRVRHGFDLGDYQRQKDQRILIEALMHKVLSQPLWKMPGLVGHMGGMVGTSMRMYSILPLMLRLKMGEPTIYQATVPSTTAMIDGVSYVVADDAALAQMMDVIDAGGDPASMG